MFFPMNQLTYVFTRKKTFLLWNIFIKQNARIEFIISLALNIYFDVADWLTDVADIYDVLQLLHSFQNRKTSASTGFQTYWGRSGPRRSQNWSCLVLVWSPAQVVLCAKFLMAIQICLPLSACFLGSLVVCDFATFDNSTIFICWIFPFENLFTVCVTYYLSLFYGHLSIWSNVRFAR